MAHIDETASVGYTIPLRITLEHGVPTLERDIRQRLAGDHLLCMEEPDRCRLSGLRDLLRHTHVRASSDPVHKIRYGFSAPTPLVRILITPNSYDVAVIDHEREDCRCRGVVYHDQHRTAHPIDLTRAHAIQDGNVLELFVPRIEESLVHPR